MKAQHPFDVHSPLTPAACAARLRGVIDTGVIASVFGSKPVLGEVSESSLRLRKRIFYGNSFQILLTATMRAEPGGTIISGECAIRALVRIFMNVWFGGLALIGGTIFVVTGLKALAGKSGDYRETLLMLIGPLLMLGFGIGIVRFGRYLARNEPRFLMDFLIETLDARPVTSSALSK